MISHKAWDGVEIFTCEKCGAVYDMQSDYARINLDFHECWIEVGN